MREYKLVYLNKGFSASREKDIQKAEDKSMKCQMKDGSFSK